MLGATVMPHVIYLHSQLVQQRNKDLTPEDKIRHYRFERLDITIAMNLAFLVNAAMVVVSAAVFYRNQIPVSTMEQAKESLTPLLGAISGQVFAIALIASGLSSSAVGTMAGQTVMQGFVGLNIKDRVTRMITMLPAMLIIISGINPLRALVLSQVILSFILPVAVIPLLLLTRRKELMGSLVNKPITNILGWIITAVILFANTALILLNIL
jgi:manganese transport protein